MVYKSKKEPRPPLPTKGEQYGSWTCLDGTAIWDDDRKRWYYWFKCQCGFKKLERHKGDIVKGRSTQCIECTKGGNLVGKVFGNWEVIEYAGINDRGERSWNCRCKCKYKTISRIGTGTLNQGNSSRCKRCNPGTLLGSESSKSKARKDSDLRRELLRGIVPEEWFDLARTKTEAEERNEQLYFYGECKNGHIALHHISYKCPICSRESRIKWELENPERMKAISSEKRRKISEDPVLRMVSSLRTRTAAAFRKIDSIKDTSTMEIVGCSRIELKQWIENQFHPNPDNGIQMTWDNFGKISTDNNTWNVDHNIPLAYAGTDWKKIMELTHYRNLQPLWAIENVRKGSTVDGVRHGKKSGPKPKNQQKQ